MPGLTGKGGDTSDLKHYLIIRKYIPIYTGTRFGGRPLGVSKKTALIIVSANGRTGVTRMEWNKAPAYWSEQSGPRKI